MLHLWHSSIYTEGLSPDARFPRDRYQLVRDEISSHAPIQFHEPSEELSLESIYAVHAPDYVDRFLNGRLTADETKRIGLRPWTTSMVQRTRILTHGTVLATLHALDHGGVSGNLGGGTHHAYHDFGSGYCIWNDLAIAARVAQRSRQCEHILILDLDVHQGDGTAAIFEQDSRVRTVSFHCDKNFPCRKMRSDHDEPFPKGTKDWAYLGVLGRFLEEEKQRKPRPDLILFQGGVDGLTTDRLGLLDLTPGGLRLRNALVFEFAASLGCPLVITMGGGYGEPLSTSISAHGDLFLQAASHVSSSPFLTSPSTRSS
ncbi:MAG: histone deacetylase [Verrucomicrobiota bacterium]